MLARLERSRISRGHMRSIGNRSSASLFVDEVGLADDSIAHYGSGMVRRRIVLSVIFIIVFGVLVLVFAVPSGVGLLMRRGAVLPTEMYSVGGGGRLNRKLLH